MILPSVKDEELDQLFPNGHDKCSMPSSVNYLRTTTDYWNHNEFVVKKKNNNTCSYLFTRF